MSEKGTLYFFTGLAGAGKTTLGGLFYRKLKEQKDDVLLLDGHQLRAGQSARGVKHDYSTNARLTGARGLFRHCQNLTNEGHDVVLCSISMYEEIRRWARENIEHYKEIYIKVPMEILYQRDQGGLYSSGEKNVVGIDLPWDEPTTPDLVVENTGEETPEVIVDRILHTFGLCSV